MPASHPCPACGETLQGVSPFCPFCGAQRAVDPLPAVEAAPVRDPVAPPPPEPPSRPAVTEKPPRPVGPTVPTYRPQPPPSPSPVWRTIGSAAASMPVLPPSTTTRPLPAPRRKPSPAERADRVAALRKLLLAAVILGCAAILWHHLTAGPQGSLVVHLTAAAEGDVTVDGTEAGAPGRTIRLEPGRHVIGFAASGWSTSPVVVRLRDGETRTVELTPVAHRAALELDSMPTGARLNLGGRRLGAGPRTLSLAPGRYHVGAALPGYQPADRTVELGAGARQSLTLTLQPDPVRTLHLLAPAGGWSEPVTLDPGDRFSLLFRGRIRVRAGGQVILLEGGRPADLGMLDGPGLAFGAVGDDAVPLDLLIRNSGAPG